MLNLSGYINNRSTGLFNSINVYSPENGEIIARVGTVDIEQIKFAFESSKKVFNLWKDVSFNIKKVILERFVENLSAAKEELADLLLKCIAKPYKACLDEISRSIAYIRCTIEVYEKYFYNSITIDEPKEFLGNKIGFFKREPLGVILAISPFNYPINLSLTKIVPAILSGNVVIFKPATQSSPVGIKLIEILINSGLPAGVVQCLVGSGNEISESLIKNEHATMINFTGSSEVGRQILNNSSVGKFVLEMGGLDAALVFKDADLDLAAKEIVSGAFNYSGQRCTAIKRVIVDSTVEEALVKKILFLVSKLSIGKAIDNADITALINKSAVDRALTVVHEAINSGAKLLTRINYSGNLLEPIVLSGVKTGMKVFQTELFAPVLPIVSVASETEMIKMANDTEYGLQASVFTSDQRKILDVFRKLDVGTVNWNKSPSRGPDYFPFVGVKLSGVGEQGIKEAIISMTQHKGLVVAGNNLDREFFEKHIHS